MTKFKMASAGAIAIAAVLAFGSAASANTVVLTDNFNADVIGVPSSGDAVFNSTSPSGNAPNPASIDIIGKDSHGNTSYDFLPGNGLYVDLDGTSGGGNTPDAGQITSKTVFGPGTYTLTFDLAGNQRGATPQTTTVTLGDFTWTSAALASSTGFTTVTETFTTTTSGALVFTENGPSDQQGNLLDNVTLSAGVPEPAAWAMMIVGLGLIGTTLRRRQQVAAGSIA